jgi:hypothetical protein
MLQELGRHRNLAAAESLGAAGLGHRDTGTQGHRATGPQGLGCRHRNLDATGTWPLQNSWMPPELGVSQRLGLGWQQKLQGDRRCSKAHTYDTK